MTGSSSELLAGASILCLRLTLVETTGSPRFPGNPSREHALLSDPGGPHASGPVAMHAMLPSVRLTTSAPHSVTFRGSITQPVRSLSTLRSSDYSESNTTQDSLPAGGQPWRGRTLTCWVASGGFHSALHLTSFPPPRSFPGAPADVTRACSWSRPRRLRRIRTNLRFSIP